jgi:hypothetical protein
MSEWTAHVAGELDQPFNTSRAPLLRATLLHGADRSVIILCVHHSIADGLALSFLMRDVLRAFASEPVRLNTETASIEHLIAAGGSTLAMPQAEATDTARPPMPYRPLDGSTPRVEAVRLTRETTRSLRERARFERCTLHGALCAALTAAASTLVPGWSDVPLRVLSPIDVRRRMLNSSEHIGLCVTAVMLDDESSTPDFWSTARSFSDRLEPAKIEGISALVGMVHDVGSSISTVQQAQEFFAQGFSAEILLTNLGAVEFKDTYGPLALHALWGPSVHTGFAMGQTVGAVTVGDQLHLLHTSYGPAIGLLGEASSLLNGALRESPGRDPKPASARLATQVTEADLGRIAEGPPGPAGASMFGLMMIDERAIGDSAFRSRLDERGRRLYAAAEVRAIGYGGLAAVARAAGCAASVEKTESSSSGDFSADSRLLALNPTEQRASPFSPDGRSFAASGTDTRIYHVRLEDPHRHGVPHRRS